MGAYIARRLVAMVAMIIALTVIVFLLFSVLPADPARLTCGKACTPQVVEANRARLGLDKPVHEQYVAFVKGIFTGRTYGSGTATFECSAPCLGYSFRRGEEVTKLFVEAVPVSAQLAFGALIIWLAAGITMGIISALRRGTWQDRTIMGAALVGYSFPSFFIGLLLIYFVQIKWRIIGFEGYTGFFDNPKQWFLALILPWLTLAMIYAAFYARLTRNQMLETMGEDFIRTARAKGLPERTVIAKHGFRAGLTPIVTAAGIHVTELLGTAVITESLFNLPGVGRLAIDAVVDYDLPIITAVTLVTATAVIIANLVVDILYAVMDPRVRLA